MIGIGFGMRHYRFNFSTPARRHLFESRGLPPPRQIGITVGPGCSPWTPGSPVYNTPSPRRQQMVCTERYIESSCDRRFFGAQNVNTAVIGGGIVRPGCPPIIWRQQQGENWRELTPTPSNQKDLDDESCWIPLTPPRLGGGIVGTGFPPVELSPFHVDGGADEVEEVEQVADVGYNTPKAVVSVSRQSTRCQPMLGSMWVRHPEHGLVRRSARIAARITCKA
jgi:hypothetical protein